MEVIGNGRNEGLELIKEIVDSPTIIHSLQLLAYSHHYSLKWK